MRLLYINKIETNAGWGYETFLNEAFQHLGVETICLDYEKNKYRLAQRLLKLDQDFDALLLQRGTGYSIPLEVIRSIRRPRFFLFTELVARNPHQHYLLNNQLFDHVFLRSLPCIEQVIIRNWLHPDQLDLVLSAINPSFHKPLPHTPKDIDVLFVGSIQPRRQKILAALAKSFNLETHTAFGVEMVELINRSKIVLNIHGEEFLDTETRVYEVLACHGFLITEKLSAESPFTDGVHLVEAIGLAEFKNSIASFLDQPAHRQQIAQAGYQAVLSAHTFLERARQLTRVIESYLLRDPFPGKPLSRSHLYRAAAQERSTQIKFSVASSTYNALINLKERLRAASDKP
jgi:hypothetical protein